MEMTWLCEQYKTRLPVKYILNTYVLILLETFQPALYLTTEPERNMQASLTPEF